MDKNDAQGPSSSLLRMMLELDPLKGVQPGGRGGSLVYTI